LRDGTFGTLSPLRELPPRTVERLQAHRFTPQRFAYYRNAQLDFSSLEALIASLGERPKHPALRPAPEADDLLTLRVLAKRPDIVDRARSADNVSRIWDACRIPNYEKRMPEHQAERLLPLVSQLIEQGRVATDYIDAQVKRLERYDGDIHVLLDRLAAVRTWTYVSHQGGWVEDAGAWRARTRTLEDRLSDLLHERLLERFVVSRISTRVSARQSVRPDRHHAFAKLAELDTYVDAEREAQKARESWIERVVAGEFAAFDLERSGEIGFEGERLGKLVAGQSMLRPTFKPSLPEWIHPGARVRIERRLHAHAKDLVAHVLEPVTALLQSLQGDARQTAPLRGLAYQLEQALGTVPRRQVAPLIDRLKPAERELLAKLQIELGRHSVFARDMLDARRSVARAALVGVWDRARELKPQVDAVPLEEPAWHLPRGMSRESCLAIGFIPLQRWAVRCDVLERLLSLPSVQARRRDAATEEVRSLLGGPADDARAIYLELPLSKRPRRRRHRRKPTGPRLDGD
jgi:ATP-dependent RNA helicase SUPV3L1/SUV3